MFFNYHLNVCTCTDSYKFANEVVMNNQSWSFISQIWQKLSSGHIMSTKEKEITEVVTQYSKDYDEFCRETWQEN